MRITAVKILKDSVSITAEQQQDGNKKKDGNKHPGLLLPGTPPIISQLMDEAERFRTGYRDQMSTEDVEESDAN